ncbi:endonuclease domain-containing protein [Antarcticibacterium sp. 1MA-6-2]|uniref:endonuclease domain-containing protein n=1 Tax=Antarcticibacterium sp. 1MA-6-2 TaxID=2908210 RepID=UPI001F415A84|nr:endonuclease domain-containing protein [Antarcticibacterium sp. 1MA-6-2]UJH90448.1 endonuclease domain-containing protein [Antarcticibacterium sp. 1MA-6-2]
MKEPIHNKKNLKPFRKELRKEMTSAEAFLWKELQHQKLEGRKFRRQHSIKSFIVDFYCPMERLIIELDGQVHLNALAEEKDRRREKELEAMGFTVLRFENKMVFENLDSVLMEITNIFREKDNE